MSAGHELDAVRSYSLPQFEGFVVLVREDRMERDRMVAGATRMAYHADKKGFLDFVEMIDGD